MRFHKTSRLLPVLLIAATLSLSACDSAQQRAEKHYQSGIALLEQGDVDRALYRAKAQGRDRVCRIAELG